MREKKKGYADRGANSGPREKRSPAVLLPFLPPLIAACLRLLFRTCKFTILGKEYESDVVDRDGPKLCAAWHFSFPALVYHYRDRGVATMVSASRDGEWAARIMTSMGYRCFRGSSGKRGSAALLQLILQVGLSFEGGFIADGSRGPARIAQKGILILARHTGAPILTFSVAARPCLRFRSWDRTVLPLPFSRVVIAFGPAVKVRKNVSSKELEDLRRRLEITLNWLTRRAEEELEAGASG